MHQRSRRAILPAIALLTAAALAALALRATRPHLAGGPSSWRGDDLAFAATWLVAAFCTAWLTLTTLACVVALARGEVGTAARIAACAPPFARRLLQTALVSAVVLSPTAARAATPPVPFTLHVGAGGRVSAPPAPSAHPDEVPVVRAPSPSTSTTTTSTTTVPATTTTTARTVPPAPTASPDPSPTRPAPVPPVEPAPAVPVASTHEYVVRAGDSLWSIAARHVTHRLGTPATDKEVANYWQRLVTANRDTLRSGDPSLIFPDEIVTLPLD